MARPRKWRKVCCLPQSCRFGPLDSKAKNEEWVKMSVDEYESIRLIDLQGFTQEECATQMNIARTTVQGIYNEARKKLATFLVQGKILWINGGEFQICEGDGVCCKSKVCQKRKENIVDNNINNLDDVTGGK